MLRSAESRYGQPRSGELSAKARPWTGQRCVTGARHWPIWYPSNGFVGAAIVEAAEQAKAAAPEGVVQICQHQPVSLPDGQKFCAKCGRKLPSEHEVFEPAIRNQRGMTWERHSVIDASRGYTACGMSYLGWIGSPAPADAIVKCSVCFP